METSWPPRLSPLHFAASKGNLSIMRTLIKIGKMDPCVHSPKGLTTAGMYTSARRRTCTKDPTASIDWLSVFRELEDMGCSLTQLSTGGDTLLMTAVQLTPSCVLGLLEAMFGETRSDKVRTRSLSCPACKAHWRPVTLFAKLLTLLKIFMIKAAAAPC